MSLWARPLGLLIFLSALFLFNSCINDDETLGLGNNSEVFDYGFIDINVPISVVLRDSLFTAGTERLLAGRYLDPDFGEVLARSYFAMAPLSYNNTLNIPSNATYDSIVLDLSYGYFYGHEGQGQTFEIHQLADTIGFNPIKYSFDAVNLGSKIAEKTFDADTALIGKRLIDFASAEDTVGISFDGEGNVLYFERFRLNDAIGMDLFQKSKDRSIEFENLNNFNNYFKGLALVPKNDNSIILGFRPRANSTRIIIFYTIINSEGEPESRILNFLVNDQRQFNEIQPNSNFSNRSGTALESLIEPYQDFNPGDGKGYYQSGANVALKLDFSFLHDIDTLENILINHAELIIGPIEESVMGLRPPQSIRYFLTNSTNRVIRSLTTGVPRTIQLDDGNINPLGSQSPLVANFNPETREYKSRITLFLQSVVNGNMDLNQVMVISAEMERTLNRFVVDNENVRIRLYYSKPKQQ